MTRFHYTDCFMLVLINISIKSLINQISHARKTADSVVLTDTNQDGRIRENVRFVLNHILFRKVHMLIDSGDSIRTI